MSFSLALQPASAADIQQKSIQQLITKINEERGAFRNVTEETLRDEIAKAATGTGNVDQDVKEDAANPQDIEARRKEVYAARNEMLKFIGYDFSSTWNHIRLIGPDKRRMRHSQPSTSYHCFYQKKCLAQKLRCHLY